MPHSIELAPTACCKIIFHLVKKLPLPAALRLRHLRLYICSMSAEKILGSLEAKKYSSVYWLEGEEPYYIDKVISFAEHKILTASEAEFNLTVFYGRDTDCEQIINACRRYPMFSEKQVVIVKEAQFLKNAEKLESYVLNPLPSTMLFVGYKDKKLDGRSKMAKLLKDKCVYLQTKKMYDSQLPEWTSALIKEKGLTVQPKALMLLIEHVGNDLSRLDNEINKLAINIKEGKPISDDDIENYIGISKEHNVFELQDAIAEKNFAKALKIILYFEQNPKSASIHQILPMLYSYFSKIYLLFDPNVNAQKQAASMFYNNPYKVKSALQCRDIFGLKGVETCLLLLHQYNLKSVGVNNSGSNDAALLKEMAVKMMI